MFFKRLLTSLWLFTLTPTLAQQEAQQDNTENQPSMQLLEFLAEFGDIDNKTYELIEYHALQDSKDKQEKTDED